MPPLDWTFENIFGMMVLRGPNPVSVEFVLVCVVFLCVMIIRLWRVNMLKSVDTRAIEQW